VDAREIALSRDCAPVPSISRLCTVPCNLEIIWWPRSALRRRVRSGSAAGPQWVRSTSAVFPQSSRSGSAVFCDVYQFEFQYSTVCSTVLPQWSRDIHFYLVPLLSTSTRTRDTFELATLTYGNTMAVNNQEGTSLSSAATTCETPVGKIFEGKW